MTDHGRRKHAVDVPIAQQQHRRPERKVLRSMPRAIGTNDVATGHQRNHTRSDAEWGWHSPPPFASSEPSARQRLRGGVDVPVPGTSVVGADRSRAASER
jgi:hypothetical protein